MELKFKVAKANTMMFDNEIYLQDVTEEIVELLCDSELSVGMAKAILKDALITIQSTSESRKL